VPERRMWDKRLITLAGIFGAIFSCYTAAQPAEAVMPELQVITLPDDEKRPHHAVIPFRRADESSWAFAIDNDVLVHNDRDQDYTYGFNLTFSGKAAQENWLSMDPVLDAIDDRVIDLPHANNHSIEMGWFGFTPENIKIDEPNPRDRPYASLVYLSNSREYTDYVGHVAWKTTFTLGMLGLDLAGSVQNRIHDFIDATEARGWNNQISQGGELTARYAIARQQHMGTIFNNTEVKSTVQASVGYLTEASWSLSVRGGKYHTAWSSFNPDLASYGERSTYTTSASAISEHYFWAGISIKARAYNAFLQGQFRESEVTYSASELNPVVFEAWAGYTLAFGDGYRLSYVLRGHSSEIREGDGDRNLRWGGLIFAKTF
jgi:hypothetical protein